MDRTTFAFVLWGPPDAAPETEDNRYFRASYFTEWRMSGKSLSDYLGVCPSNEFPIASTFSG